MNDNGETHRVVGRQHAALIPNEHIGIHLSHKGTPIGSGAGAECLCDVVFGEPPVTRDGLGRARLWCCLVEPFANDDEFCENRRGIHYRLCERGRGGVWILREKRLWCGHRKRLGLSGTGGGVDQKRCSSGLGRLFKRTRTASALGVNPKCWPLISIDLRLHGPLPRLCCPLARSIYLRNV